MASRRTTPFVESPSHSVSLDWTAPDFSTPSRRQKPLAVKIPCRGSEGPPKPLIDRTGIELDGEGERRTREDGGPKRRAWRKIHPGIGGETLGLRTVEITGSHTGDAPILPDLLSRSPEDRQIGSVTTDGAHDTRRRHSAIADRGAHAVIPPRKNAKPWGAITAGAMARDHEGDAGHPQSVGTVGREVATDEGSQPPAGLGARMAVAMARTSSADDRDPGSAHRPGRCARGPVARPRSAAPRGRRARVSGPVRVGVDRPGPAWAGRVSSMPIGRRTVAPRMEAGGRDARHAGDGADRMGGPTRPHRLMRPRGASSAANPVVASTGRPGFPPPMRPGAFDHPDPPEGIPAAHGVPWPVVQHRGGQG